MTATLRDASGTCHAPTQGAARIVSLVPSLTELLFALGLGPQVVGRTGFCTAPADAVRDLPKVGGTKDVNLDRLRALAPTHVIVNIDENTRETVEAMRTFVPHIIVTHPCAPEDNFALYALLGGIFGRQPEAAALGEALRHALDDVARTDWPARQVIYCIWQDPWMTVSRDTYISRMLALVNWQTWPASDADLAACSGGNCARPPAPGTRYPAFRWQDEVVRATDLILLSTEPYRFTEQHCDALERQTGTPVALIDGAMVSWYGSRAIESVRALATFAREWA